MKSRVAVIFVVLALLVELLAICAPAARAQSGGEVVLHSFDGSDGPRSRAAASPKAATATSTAPRAGARTKPPSQMAPARCSS